MREKAEKAKEKSANAAHQRSKSRAVPLSSGSPAVRRGDHGKGPAKKLEAKAGLAGAGGEEMVGKRGGVRSVGIQIATMAGIQGAVPGGSVGRDRGPAPPLPTPIATFNI